MDQCDHIWQNLDTLAKNIKVFGNSCEQMKQQIIGHFKRYVAH